MLLPARECTGGFVYKVVKYSFLLPAYKGAFLKEALDSIQAQTYEDFSVVISDDCSPDPLYEIVRPFLADSRFRYRRNDSNIGAEQLVRHWNLLVKDCDSPYLIMAGDDDLYEPTFLEEMDKLVIKYPDANLFRSRMDIINESGVISRTDPPDEEYQTRSEFINSLFDGQHLHSVGNYIFKTDFLVAVGGFKDFPLGWFSDDVAALICSENGVARSPAVLFHFRHSGINISSREKVYDHLKSRATISFHKWFRKQVNIPGNVRKGHKEYCLGLYRHYWKGLSFKQRGVVLLNFPVYGWRIVKDRFAHLLDLCSVV